MTKLWGGRFAEEPAAELMAFTESLSFDHILVREDCEVLAAHAGALARAGLLTGDEADSVARALEGIAADIESGGFTFEPGDEDIHTAVERALLGRLPEVALRVRAGLSRNDRVVTALRLWLLRNGREVVAALCDLIEVLASRARENIDTVMPGYTHLQRAQPVSLGHHLLAHVAAFQRDAERMVDALGRADASALGAGALAASTLGIDPAPTAEALGFSRHLTNSIDAVSARDFVAEFCAAAAICGVHASRLGEELVLWTSEEFAFASLSDAYATGSSLMPQKKNPDVAELARGKAGRLIGNLTGLLVTMKGLPLAYNRDLQEDKEPLFDSVRTMRLMLPALAGALASVTFDVETLSRAAGAGTLLATDLAEHLVREGMSFREAHDVVGVLVRRALEDGGDLAGLPDADLPAGARAVLDARASLARRGAPGPSGSSVEAQIEDLGAWLQGMRAVT